MLAATIFLFQTIFLQSVEHPASVQAEKINTLFNYFNVAAACMLLLVGSLIAFICIRFARKKADDDEPVQTPQSKTLEAFMIGIPALLLAFFFYNVIVTMRAVAPAPPEGQKPDVVITGHQWWWEVKYPSTGVVSANEIHLPVGKTLLMEMHAADVIHDWWVPELGNKIDVVPGRTNYLTLHIKKPGHYIGACSEFCGAQHAWMRINVIAESPASFQKWLLMNEPAASPPEDELAATGARLFQTKTCANCHRIRGTNANGTEGPDLTHLASRKNLLTGLLQNTPENLLKWVSHPQRIKPGAHMPDFKLQQDSVKAIVSYLAQLK